MSVPPPWSGQLRLQDGPFLKHAGAARRNTALAALSPLVLGPVFAAWGLTAAPPGWARIWALAGGLAAVLIFAPERRRALLDLDWAVAAILAGLLLTPPWNPGPGNAAGFICGLAAGWLTSRPRFAALLGRPGLIPLSVLALASLLSPLRFFDSSLATAPLFGHVPLRDILALAAAGLCLGRRRTLAWVLPWLAWLAGVFLELLIWSRIEGSGFGLTRVAVLLLPALFVVPRMARSKTGYGLALAGAIPALGLGLYFPHPFGFDPIPLYGLFLIVGPLWLAERRRKISGPGQAAVPPPDSRAAVYTRCGHQGRAPLLAHWAGPPSCRLAAVHDDGFLLCPYGCLGLGDCVRACPHGAVALKAPPASLSGEAGERRGVPIIDAARCRGCGSCARACPRRLPALETGAVRVFIPCASRSSLKKNAGYCPRSCLGCGRCRKACPAGAIGRPGPNGAMAVDQTLCRAYGPGCARACARACPRQLFDAENGKAVGPLGQQF